MATYKAKPITINKPAADIAARFADLTYLQDSLDSLPAEERAKVGDVRFTADTIVMNTAQVGEIKFEVKERTPERVAFVTAGLPLPMPMTIAVDMKPESADVTEVVASLDIGIPAVLRPMVGGTMQKAVDQFAALIANLNK